MSRPFPTAATCTCAQTRGAACPVHGREPDAPIHTPARGRTALLAAGTALTAVLLLAACGPTHPPASPAPSEGDAGGASGQP